MDAYLFRLLEAREQAAADEDVSFGRGLELDAPPPPPVVVPLLVQLKNAGVPWIVPPGVEISSQLGDVLVVSATREGCENLLRDANVVRCELSREGGQEDCLMSVPFVKASQVHVPPVAEKGGRALVAILDRGIDVLHEAFLDANGASRVIGIWDQTDASGRSPKQGNPSFTQTYGTYHDRSAIAGYVQAKNVPVGLGRDPGGHGTHVASIAAGRAVGAFAGGVAPEARIVVVKPRLLVSPVNVKSIGYSVAHVDALAFIRTFAELEKLPVVVNVSLGMNAGAHDGTSLLEAAFDRFTSGGRDAGYAVVKSAGNEFRSDGHAFLRPVAGLVLSVEWSSAAQISAQPRWDYIEGWFDSAVEVELTLEDPAGNRSTTVKRANPLAAGTLGKNSYHLELTRFHTDNGNSRIVVHITPGVAPAIQSGTWKLEVLGVRVPASAPGIHFWVERDDLRPVRFASMSGAVNESTLSIPGTARSVITVGACTSSWPLAPTATSSRGPTRDARRKPDLAAPGQAILAADGGTQNGVAAKTGTSMAAPHVTGAIALLFSRQCGASVAYSNAAQICAALSNTTQNFTGQWSDAIGFGCLDAKAFLEVLG